MGAFVVGHVLVLAGVTGAAFAAPDAATPAPAPAPAAVTEPTPPAPEAVPTGPALSLRQALTRAVSDNPDLQRERVAVDTARANLTAAEGQFDFVLSSDGTFARRTTPRVRDNNPTAGFTNTLALDLGLQRALETGGSVALVAQQTSTRTNSPIQCGALDSMGVIECSFHSTGVNLTFNHPLLRGFGTEVAMANLRKQHILRDVALLNRQARAAVVVRDVVVAYWELAYATADLAIRHSAVELAAAQRASTQAQVDIGKLGLADLAAVDRAIADRQLDVAVAEQTRLGRALDLEKLLGRPVQASFAAPATDPVPDSSDASDLPAAMAHALESSPALRALRAGQDLTVIDLRTAEALLRPRLDLTASIGAAGRKAGLGDAWSQTANLDDKTWSLGLAFQWPLQNRAAEGVAGAARAADVKTRIDLAALENDIRGSVVRLSMAARTAARRRDLARQAVTYAQQNLDAERARFDVGRSTNNDVLLRQQEMKAAEIQVARASADAAEAQGALAAVTGEILDDYGLVLRGS